MLKELKALATGDLDRAINTLPKNNELDVQTILNWIYGIMGVVTVAFLVYSAVGYLTSQGDPAKAKKASQSVAFALIGLGVILLAAAITTFFFGALSDAQK